MTLKRALPFFIALALLAATAPAHAQYAVAGAACPTNGVLANSNGFLTCTGGYWVINPVVAASLSVGTNTPLVSVDLSNKTDALALPIGTTGTRPTGGALINGEIRYNSTLASVEAYVNGAWVSLLSGSGSGSSIPAAGSTGYIQFNTSGNLNADSGLVWDNTNKRLGIGSSTPANLLDLGAFTGTASNALHLASATGYDSTLKLMETSDNYGFTIKNSNGSTGLTGLNILRHSNSAAGTSALFVGRDTGSIGIGTTSPVSKLTIAGGNYITPSADSTSAIGFASNTAPTTPVLNIDTTNSRIGIGTASPAQALDVVGNINLASTTSPVMYFGKSGVAAPGAGSAGEKIALYGTSGTNAANDYALGIESSNMWFNSGGGFKWYNSASFAMALSAAGNVGIGTASPSYQLDNVATDATTSGTLSLARNYLTVTPTAASSGNDYAQYNYTASASAYDITGILRGSFNQVAFSGTATLTSAHGAFNQAGNTGTGTITNTFGGYNYAYNNSTGTTGTMYGAYNYGHNVSTGTATTIAGAFDYARNSAAGSVTNLYGSSIQVTNANASGTVTNARGINVAFSNSGTITTGYGIYVGTIYGDTNYGIYQAGSANQNYFAGNVGIGTTSPVSKLTIAGGNYITPSADSTSAIGFASNTAPTTPVLNIDTTNGRVGIGTSASDGLLHLYGVSGISLTITATGTTLGPSLQLNASGTNGHRWALLSSQAGNGPGAGAFDIYDVTAAADRLTIGTTGNVGIGSTAPVAKLDVSGTIRPVGATAGAACSPLGAQAYNSSTGAPMYCSSSAVWTSSGGSAGFSSCTTVTGSPTATCPGGYTVTGGGCNPSNVTLYQSYPSGNGWYCRGGVMVYSTVKPSNGTAYAICCH